MQFQALLSAAVVVLSSVTPYVTATPVRCPDTTRDAILQGLVPPEACCSYGRCLGDVVIASG